MSASTTQLWGRAWKLTVKYLSGPDLISQDIISQDKWDPESLRITFDVLESTLPAKMWFATISIYNLNEPTRLKYLWNAVWATLEAGYQTGPNKSSIIWDGPVLQVMFDRENVVDLKVTLNCIGSIPEIDNTIVNVSAGALSSQAQVVSQMMSQVGPGFSVNYGDTANQLISQKRYPRGKTVFGRMSRYLFQMADDNFLAAWVNGNQAYMVALGQDSPDVPDLNYSPPAPPGYTGALPAADVTQSVLGVPRQFPAGLIFTVLLDPRLIVKFPPLLVHLDRTIFTQMKLTYPDLPPITNTSWTFVAAQIHHYGDTRGNDWATEVTGYTKGYAKFLLNGGYAANSGGQ